jgi:anti-sigma factor RsiW
VEDFMSAHPDLKTLRGYARGKLAPAETMTVDAHAQDCETCRATLTALVEPLTMRRVLARVEREGGHLAFEELSALVDGKLAAARRPIVERHIQVCSRCRRQWLDMQQFAPVLAKSLAVKATATTTPGLLDRLGSWLGTSNGMRGVAAGVVAAAAAALVVSGHLGSDGTATRAGNGNTNVSATQGGDTPAMPPVTNTHEPGTLDRGVFDRLDHIAPEALIAYRANDFATVAKALKVRADRGEAGAAHALGLLYAEGRGVGTDRVRAIYLLKQAIANGDQQAEHNLSVLQAATARGSYSQ